MVRYGKLLGLALIGAILLSTEPLTAYASDGKEDSIIETINPHAEETLLEDLEENLGIVSGSDMVNADEIADRFKVESFANILALGENGEDQYEPNNMVSTATSGLMGRKISATLHDGDVDWYKFEALDISEPYSFVLMNIPSGCDYDMALFNSDLSSAYYDFQDGTTAEAFYITLNSEGIYYVAVQSNSGFSSSPYTLYFGPAFKTRSTGWRSTGLSFSFGYIPQGSSSYTQVPKQHYNLTNDSTIPNGSVMTQLYIDANGNGGTWGGFYKYIQEPSGYGMEQYGNLDAFAVPDMAYYVKQDWQIWGKILYSYSFTWQPNILIAYKYIVTPQTMSYVS